MVKLKKVMSIVMIIMILFTFVNLPKVYAVENIIIANLYNKQLIATMIIASGMVFNSAKQIDDSVTAFIDYWNDHETGWRMPTPKDPQGPNTWQAIIIAAAAGGAVVYDITSGTFKQVLELTEDFVDFVQEFVNMKYQQFENWLIDPAYWVLPRSVLKTNYFPEKNHDYYVYRWNGATATNISTTGCQYFKYSEAVDMYEIRSIASSTNEWTNTPLRIRRRKSGTEIMLECIRDSSPATSLMMDNYMYRGDHIISTVPLETGNPDVVLPEGTEEDLGYGNPNMVDNSDYQYNHNDTGTPTIVMPIQSPELDENGYFVPNNDVNDLVDVGVDEIANERTDGIVVPTPTPSPSPEPVPYPNLPGEDTATEEDYDNTNKRALYQRKFPFCLPWDIRAVFMLLNAPAKAPRFEIDVVPGSVKGKIGITGETEFVFDMSEFELVGQVTRFFSFIGFCLTLIFITRNIIKS